jgi:hypothetical protein
MALLNFTGAVSVVATATAALATNKNAAADVTATSSSSASAGAIYSAKSNAKCSATASASASKRWQAATTVYGVSSSSAGAEKNPHLILASANVTATSSSKAKAGIIFKVSSAVSATSSTSAGASVIKTGLTVCDVLRDILMCWGMEQPCAAPEMARTSALNILNNAMQTLWNQAKDRNYWTSSTLTVTFGVGVSTVILDNTIQNVIGPARLTTGEPLTPLGNVSEFETFDDAFIEDEPSTKPVSYFIDRSYQSGNDPAKCAMMISPVPTQSVSVRLDVVLEAPRYNVLDFVSCPVCPIPHKYVESLLLPVCRYLASHSHLFIQRDRQAIIEKDYMQARELLDVADPLPGQSGDNIAYRKGEREKS